MHRLGVVSFLNSRPLIEGLAERGDVEIVFDVPALLPGRLERREVDAALVPLVDVLRRPQRFRVLSDACIACDGETMTVRVYAQVPPERIRTLWVDPDSHTSVALAALLWSEVFGTRLHLQPFDADGPTVDSLEAVLLIGDKVVQRQSRGFAYQVDLGGAWRQHTGLPFVFAVWAHRNEAGAPEHLADLAAELSAARDRGVARAAEIAATQGPALGWPVDLARQYLTRCLRFALDARAIESANLFARLCAERGLVAHAGEIAWPESLLAAKPG